MVEIKYNLGLETPLIIPTNLTYGLNVEQLESIVINILERWQIQFIFYLKRRMRSVIQTICFICFLCRRHLFTHFACNVFTGQVYALFRSQSLEYR